VYAQVVWFKAEGESKVDLLILTLIAPTSKTGKPSMHTTDVKQACLCYVEHSSGRYHIARWPEEFWGMFGCVLNFILLNTLLMVTYNLQTFFNRLRAVSCNTLNLGLTTDYNVKGID
jgi:hypothetical protein